MQKETWLLPEGIEEILPPQARRIEGLRRAILDMFDTWGYDLVIPPMIEYLESLLTGTGADLDLRTFKLTDQLSGRMMGIRADMTPQIARIDAHRLRSEQPTRLCYLDTVLHTRADGFSANRSPLQIGAEIFGHAGVESDVEILQLMWRTLELSGIEGIYLDLGHVGIFRGLAHQAGLNEQQEASCFDALQRKCVSEVAAMLEDFGIRGEPARMLTELPRLDGKDALQRARETLAAADASVQQALNYLSTVAEHLQRFMPAVPVHFDLAELRGYHYKTGVVFAAFAPGSGEEVARGGRYDDIGKVFGRSRHAVGFSTDLKTILSLGGGADTRFEASGAVASPWSDDPALQVEIKALRAQGRRVIRLLPGQEGSAQQMGCDAMLTWRDNRWITDSLT
jgi:ATP phosphoribosyltransferase regulatory subunit